MNHAVTFKPLTLLILSAGIAACSSSDSDAASPHKDAQADDAGLSDAGSGSDGSTFGTGGASGAGGSSGAGGVSAAGGSSATGGAAGAAWPIAENQVTITKTDVDSIPSGVLSAWYNILYPNQGTSPADFPGYNNMAVEVGGLQNSWLAGRMGRIDDPTNAGNQVFYTRVTGAEDDLYAAHHTSFGIVTDTPGHAYGGGYRALDNKVIHWLKFRMFFQGDAAAFPDVWPNWWIGMQLHGANNPEVHFGSRDGYPGLWVSLKGHPVDNVSKTVGTAAIPWNSQGGRSEWIQFAPKVDRNRWYDVVMRIYMDPQGSGSSYKLWLDGTQVVDDKGILGTWNSTSTLPGKAPMWNDITLGVYYYMPTGHPEVSVLWDDIEYAKGS